MAVCTDLNADIGAIVRRNQTWDPEWGTDEIHPPQSGTGVVVGFTTRDCEVHGDIDGEWGQLARVQWEGAPGWNDYRIGFAEEFWLEVVSGGANRLAPIEYGGLFDGVPTGFPVCRLRRVEDESGQTVAYCPPTPSAAELAAEATLQLFWRVHAGDVEAVRRILADNPDLINARCLPYEFPCDEEFPWPYTHYDGVYNDTAAMLACRYCHSPMLQLLLELGTDIALTNDDGGTCATIATDGSKLVDGTPFSDEGGSAQVMCLLGLTGDPPVVPRHLGGAAVSQWKCIRGSFCELTTCVASGGEGMKWLLVNGHSDPEQVDYCESMVKAWRQALTQRGDTVAAELFCPTKALFSETLQSLFLESGGGACGLFVICHGGEKAGEWVSFNPADTEESFGWEDIEAAGLYDKATAPSQFFVVGDSCYSAKMGKKGFVALRERHHCGENVPICSMLMASDKPEKNFSCMFALEAMAVRRKLSRATCAKVKTEAQLQENSAGAIALEIMDDISVDTDDHDPFFFFYAPTDAIDAHREIYTL